MFEITVTTNTVYNNKDLRKATDMIYACDRNIKANQFAIAWLLMRVDKMECYVDDGFHTTAEWAEKTFGFKKSLTSNLVRIGYDYVEQHGEGETAFYTSNLVPLGCDDFTTSQIAPMLPIAKDKVIELVNNSDITPDMSVRDIIEAVKPFKKKRNKKGDETPVEATEAPTSDSVTSAENSTRVERLDEIDTIFKCLDILKRGDESNISHWVDDVVERLCKLGYAWRIGTVLTAYEMNNTNETCEDCQITFEGNN